MSRPEDILQQHRLKHTRLRKAVLEKLLAADKGLSHQDLSKDLEVSCNRVTLFRTLHVFEEAGILHKIMDPDGTSKYAYSTHPEGSDTHSHAHFVCLYCKEIFCLNEVALLKGLKVPKGFEKVQLDVQIKGYCNKCREVEKPSI